MAYKLSRYAEADIENILTYTIETWGIKQFHTYRKLIEDSIERIGKEPETGLSRKREELFPGCRSYPFGKHIIFYRINPNWVEVVRILHQRMEYGSHIPEEFRS